MIKVNKVKTLVEQAIAGRDIFVVELSVSPDNCIEVSLDSMTAGVSLDDCVAVNRFIENNLSDDENYELVVASAGLGQPFKLLQQYKKNMGKEVEVLLKSGLKQKGILCAVTESDFTIEYEVNESIEGKKRKQLVIKSSTIKLDDVKATKLVVHVR